MTINETRLRSVLAAPRGHRFSRPGATSAHPRTTSACPRQTLPTRPESPQEREQRLLRQMAGNPRVAYRLEHGVIPHWMHVAREQQEQEERKARAAASIPEEPVPVPPRGRHRAPRQWWAWPAVAVGTVLLLGLQIGEAVGEGFIRTAGILP